MLQRGEVSHAQFAISALLMDIENYCDKGDASFHYQNVGHKIRYGADSDVGASNNRFRKTIDSVMQSGYREDSLLDVGSDLTLHNGTHRTAICLYLKRYGLRGNAFRYKSPFFLKTAKEFVKRMGFPQDYVDEVLGKYRLMQDALIADGVSYCCVYGGDQLPVFLNANNGVHIHKTYRLKPVTGAVGGGILFKDDLLKDGGLLCQFTLDEPDYEIKGNKAISRTCERMGKNDKSILQISKNCLEGKALYDLLSPYFDGLL